MRALDEEVASSVHTNCLGELVEGDDVAAALPHPFAADRHKLVDQHFDGVGIQTKAGRAGLETLDIAMMIGAEHIDCSCGTTLELEIDVGEVGRKVGRLAICFQQHAILVIAERGGAEPGGVVLLEDVSFAAGAVDRCRHGTA